MRRHLVSLALLGVVCGCGTSSFDDTPVEPVQTASLDAQARQLIGGWGVVPILPVRVDNEALVDLGRSLFFDKILSGNRDVSCATCHSPELSLGDGQSLAVGTGSVGAGAARSLGAGREFTPRNAPGLFNSALGMPYTFWDGRVSNEGGPLNLRMPPGMPIPSGLSGLLAAQAMVPVTNRVEMRGVAGDKDVFGAANELATISDADNAAIWAATMKRVLSIPEYLEKFRVAYPTTLASSLGFQHAANAIAAFETQTFSKTNSAFDRYLARDDNALSADAKRGAILFFSRARCSTCHNGPMLGGQSFASVAVPQIGPGTGSMAPLDGGREQVFPGSGGTPVPGFLFRVAPLRNVELTAPYFHNGAYATLEAVVRHYNNVDSALKSYDPSPLDPAIRASYHGDATTLSRLRASLDPRLQQPLALTPDEQHQLVEFLKSLTDPSARNMAAVAPASVPSGLPVR
jgi:cytochrome c peroxidase